MAGSVRGCGAWLAISMLSMLAVPQAVGMATRDRESELSLEKREESKLLCQYLGFQSIFTQNRIYVDGGLRYFQTSIPPAAPVADTDYPKELTYIDLNKSFNYTAKTSDGFDLFTTYSDKSASRSPILFGALMGSDYSWIQYGGMYDPVTYTNITRRSQSTSEKFDVTQDPNNPATQWTGDNSFAETVTLGSGITNYVYAGAVAYSPGDRKSWLFSGVTGKNWSEVVYSRKPPNQPLAPAALSDRLITLDLSDQKFPSFSNTTIDTKTVAPRAGASMVFLPVGDKGILVVIGGVNVYDPVWLVPNSNRLAAETDDQILKDEDTSRGFLETIDIYDIGSGKWYSQKTTGDVPPQPISAGCAVAATADDRSSHNIYVYGGHGGLSHEVGRGESAWETNTKFYVLSLPSFKWIEVLDPDTNKVTGRSLHQCHRVQEDQMLIVGGTPNGNREDVAVQCALYPGQATVFNLNTCEVQDAWDPTVTEEYQVPKKVIDVIGGTGSGSATLLKPDGGWDNDALGELFADTKAYTNSFTPVWSYTPDKSTGEDPTGTGTGSPTSTSSSDGSGGSSLPSYIAPLLGTLLGLFGLITVLSIILFILRRRKQKRKADTAPSETEGSTVRKNKQTWSWLLGVYGDEKSSRGGHHPLGHMRNYSDDMSGTGTGTTLMYGASEGNRESVMSPISPLTERSDPVMELQGKVIHEMPDTSRPQELAGAGYAQKNASKSSLRKEAKTVRYEDREGNMTVGDPSTGNDIQEMRPLGHRKMSSLDYPE